MTTSPHQKPVGNAAHITEAVVDQLLARTLVVVPTPAIDAVLLLLAWDGRAVPDGAGPDGEVHYRGRDTPVPDADHHAEPAWGDGEWPVALSFTGISAHGHVVTYSPATGWRCTCPQFTGDTGLRTRHPRQRHVGARGVRAGELSISTAAFLEVIRHNHPVSMDALADQCGITRHQLTRCIEPRLRRCWLTPARTADGVPALAAGPAYHAVIPLDLREGTDL